MLGEILDFAIDSVGRSHYVPAFEFNTVFLGSGPMKVLNSLKSAKKRHRDCRVVRRKGRVYVINKTNRRFKARQG